MKSGYIYLHDTIFPALLAISAEEQRMGLMHQPWPPPVMAFVYGSPQINRFWMRNTISPLDIIFCHQNKVSQICQGEPNSLKAIGDFIPSDLVIELPLGTALASNIKIGHSAGLVAPKSEELRVLIAEKTGYIPRI